MVRLGDLDTDTLTSLAGFSGPREWADRHRPPHVLHGHTQPDPRTRAGPVGGSEVVRVSGAAVVDLRRPPPPASSTR